MLPLAALAGGALGLLFALTVDPGVAGRPRNTPPSPTPDSGIWISPSQLRALPTSGPAYEAMEAAAQGGILVPNLADEKEDANVRILAKAYMYVLTGLSSYRLEVIAGLLGTRGSEDAGRALSLGRNLLSLVIAAELVGLGQSQEAAFSSWLDAVRHEELAGRTLVSTHEDRANNWGTHAGASRMASAVYLGDWEDLENAAAVFRGYLGDRESHAGFVFGNDLSWHLDPLQPVPVNPLGATKDGFSIDGVLPDDQRRAGPFQWPPPDSNYPYGALQGALAQAVILHRLDYDVWSWGDQALLRAFQWLRNEAQNPIEEDDEWMGHLVNSFYGTDFPAPIPALPGKNIGWTDWTHPSP
jgi:hypothetical protein